MFKYLLLKSIYDLSDVDIVERSKYDMSFKYFLDMAPEDSVINPSSLTKFRKLRLQDEGLLDMLIGKRLRLHLKKKSLKVKQSLWIPHIQKHVIIKNLQGIFTGEIKKCSESRLSNR